MITRRQFAQTALAALPAASAFARPKSSDFGGVEVGIIAPYAFRGTADDADVMGEHALDGEMRLARVGGAEDGCDVAPRKHPGAGVLILEIHRARKAVYLSEKRRAHGLARFAFAFQGKTDTPPTKPAKTGRRKIRLLRFGTSLERISDESLTSSVSRFVHPNMLCIAQHVGLHAESIPCPNGMKPGMSVNF